MSDLTTGAAARRDTVSAGAVRRLGPWVAGAALLVVLPMVFTSGTAITVMSLMGIMIVFSLSYNMLLGQTGMLSFGHAVYYGLGGFVTAHALNLVDSANLLVPLPLVPLIGGATGLLFGMLFGAVSTQRAGTAFAMISLGIGELVAASSLILRGFFGGEEGISTNRTAGPALFGITFGPNIQVYYLIAVWCFVCIGAMYAITRTPLGRMCNAVRDNPERAEFVGYNTQHVRFLAFSLSGLFAGIAGALAAINFEIMTAANVGAAQSGAVLLMTFIGGVGHFVGPILGAVVITLLQVTLSDFSGIWLLYLGLLFILVVMYAPGGLAGLLMLHQPLWRAGTLHRVLPVYLVAAVPGLASVIGAVMIIEMSYHLSVKAPTEGTGMAFFGVAFDAAAVLPWLVALMLAVGGFWLFRRTWPWIGDAWHRAGPGVGGGP